MRIKITLGIFIALAFLFIQTTSVSAEISGSAHDFSDDDWNPGNKICEPCHTPHNAVANTDAPLWNHSVSQATYQIYSSQYWPKSYFDWETPVQPEYTGSITRLCLSCHDGTLAPDAFGDLRDTPTESPLSGRLDLGTDLSDDHPVSIEWSHATVSEDDSRCSECHIDDDIDMPLPFFGPESSKRLECATCHDPHNNGPEQYLLRQPLANSEICLTCHTNKE